ncbi:Esterase PHB depolymerase [Novymonas esmeraldas]|uniref:Esterase PHB depolymerase n=1 Tax=Novymonas esmeraldas TaxID=1808958 RepID=A0AAW0F2W4_9TRYP
MSTEAAFDEGSVELMEQTPLKTEETAGPVAAASRSMPRLHAPWLMYLILAVVILVVVPLGVRHRMEMVRRAATDPISLLVPFGEKFDTQRLIRELNPAGKKIHMASLVTAAEDGCVGNASRLPRGQQTVVTFTTAAGDEREAVVYVPESYPAAPLDGAAASTPVAMMVLFHGLNDNCKHFLDATGFLPFADRDGFVIASVCGSQGYLGTAWNAGMCCGFSNDKPDDVGLAKQVVTELSKSVCVDRQRVMAVGFSNGAMLAEVLACEAPGHFRAAVSIGGVVELRPGNAAGLEKCTAALANTSTTDRTSLLMVHGTADVMVPWGGNSLLGFPSITANLEAWAERNGCGDETNTTISTPTYSNTIYARCHAARGAVSPPLPSDPRAPLVSCIDLRHHHLYPTEDVDDDDEAAWQAQDGTSADEGKQSTPDMDTEEMSVRQTRAMLVDELKHEHHKDDGEGTHAHEDRHKDHHHRPHRPHDHHRDNTPPHHHHRHHDSHPPHNESRRHHGGKHDHEPRRHELPTGSSEVTPRGPDGASQVELVRVKDGGHSWPRDKEFSTTDYIYEFGIRVFGRYN